MEECAETSPSTLFSPRCSSKKVKHEGGKSPRNLSKVWIGGVGEFLRCWVLNVGHSLGPQGGFSRSRAAVKLLAV